MTATKVRRYNNKPIRRLEAEARDTKNQRVSAKSVGAQCYLFIHHLE